MALHEALSYGDWERALRIIEDRLANTDAEVPGLDEVFGGKLPLHVACENGAPATILTKLMDAFPGSTSVPAEPCGRLPLHFAVGVGAPAPVDSVELLLKAFGCEGGLAVDENGRTPLHMACANADLCLPEAFDLLLTYAPAATTAVDRRGCTPLHLAAGDGTVTQVQRLLAASPQTVDAADGTNKLPIHWAAMKESPPQVTELLLTTNPTSISQLDKNGKGPLHLIAKNSSKAALEKAEMLLKACPASVHWQANDGKTPLGTAKSAGRRALKMTQLFQRWSDALPPGAEKGATSPLSTVRQRLVWACAQHPRLGGESVAHIVPHELAAMVANWFLDTPLTGKAIGALLAANAGSAEAVRAAGAARLAQLRLQARCAAGALPVRNTVESEWARRMGGGGASLVRYEGLATEGGGGQLGESCSCIEGNPCAVPYNCLDWANRHAVAKAAREGKGQAGGGWKVVAANAGD